MRGKNEKIDDYDVEIFFLTEPHKINLIKRNEIIKEPEIEEKEENRKTDGFGIRMKKKELQNYKME